MILILSTRSKGIIEAVAAEKEVLQEDCVEGEAVDQEYLQEGAATVKADELTKALVDMAYKLQHVTFRNGWLESKLEELQKDVEQRDEQIKLLTDSRKSAWWSRFANCFLKGSSQ